MFNKIKCGNERPAVQKLTVVELNEFNVQLLSDAVRELNLSNLKWALGFSKVNTFTNDTYESNALEPWVQWVSIHTGVPAEKHGIRHLGDVPHLGTDQIWETLSKQGVSCGVWGVMNGSRSSAENCKFFFPDPWTFSESGSPNELAQLLELPRFLAKNYLNLSVRAVAPRLLQFMVAVFRSGMGSAFLLQLPEVVFDICKRGSKHFVFIAHMDLLAAKLYARYTKKYSPDFSVLFLNSIAHAQHHYWDSSKSVKENTPLTFTFKMIDRALGVVRKTLADGQKFLLMNGLSQKNTNDEPTWILYKLKDHQKFLQGVGVVFTAVEPHMTYDAHVFFNNRMDRDNAVDVLKALHIGDEPLFLIETYDDDERKIFYRVNFSAPLGKEAKVSATGTQFAFFEFFESVVVRTGKHIPNGVVHSNLDGLPNRMFNHEVASKIVKHFSG